MGLSAWWLCFWSAEVAGEAGDFAERLEQGWAQFLEANPEVIDGSDDGSDDGSNDDDDDDDAPAASDGTALPPSKWRPGQTVVVPASAFGEAYALANPGMHYTGTILELDDECAAGRTWLVDYAGEPHPTDEAFFAEAAASPAPNEADDASVDAPAESAPPLSPSKLGHQKLRDAAARRRRRG